jgi:hypothetical protein
MSLAEILVVMLVAIMVTKPEDIPVIIKKLQQFKLYCLTIKKQLLLYITQDLKTDPSIIENDAELLNFYLQKILSIQGHYDGSYSISELKKNYDKLVKMRITESSRTSNLK